MGTEDGVFGMAFGVLSEAVKAKYQISKYVILIYYTSNG
jgi:hypothetical protein